MTRDLKVLLNLHLSVEYLIFRKPALFHENKKVLTMWKPDSGWVSRLAFHIIAAHSVL